MAAGRGATLRDAVYRPIDIVIADLSVSGFGMTTSENLAVGSCLNLSIAGINKRDVRITRRYGMNYGCEFTLPLSAADLDLALRSGAVVDASFAMTDQGAGAQHASDGSHGFKASPRIRATVLLVTIAVLWAGLLSLIHLLIGALTVR